MTATDEHVPPALETALRLLGAHVADLGNPTQAWSRAVYRHHHDRLTGEALWQAVVEQVTADTHPDCTDREREPVIADRLKSEYGRRLVAAAAEFACGAHADHTDQAFAAISGQTPGQPTEETP